MAIWSVVGMLSTPAAFVIILGTLFLFVLKERYWEALFGLFFLICLSDNTEKLWYFAKTIKPFYVLIFSMLIIVKFHKKDLYFDILKKFGLYLFIAIICIYFSYESFVSIQKTLSYILILFLVPTVIYYEYKKSGKTLCANLIAFSVIIHLISLSVIIFFPEVGISHGDRWQGMFGNPNGLGLFLLVWHILFRLIDKSYSGLFTVNERIFYLAITLVYLWFSGSRNAMLSIASFEIALYFSKYSKFLTILIIVSVLFYFDFIYEFVIQFLYDIGLSSSLRLDNIEDGSGRYIAWNFAWEYIKYDSLLLGHGIGYDEMIMRANHEYLSRLGHEGGVHNTYLIVWLNTGLVGLIGFLFALITLILKYVRTSNFILPAFLAYLISAFYEPWLASSLNPYTIMFVTFIILIEIINNEKIKESSINIH